jgi:CheY-like chemotaxis protein
MLWAAVILSSLVHKLQNQKQILSDQAIDIKKARDEALYANSAKSNFLANMSHEIRTPLTSIIGFAESCLDIHQSMKERLKATKTIIKNGKHLMRLINEILDLSKIEAGRLEIEIKSFSVMEVLDEISQLVSIMAEEKGLTFGVNYTYPIPEKIISDPLRLKQILINLCSNAIKFTRKGHVYLNIAYIPESTSLVFEVVDTGIGMSAEQKEKIFSPFVQADSSTTRKFGGTGLGLTLSQQLAEMLNGEITVESIINKGSRFTVKIKIDEVENSNYIHERAHKKVQKKPEELEEQNVVPPKLHGKVLLVEDNKDIQALVKLLLKKVGVDLDIVDDGQQAINNAMNIDYDLVLMDMQMPVMDGLTAMQKLKQQGYTKPVIVMTANAMKKVRDNCKAAGFSGFVSKPIERADLYAELIKYLKPNTSISESDTMILTSSLLKDEPHLIDLINKFMKRLPAMRDAINLAHSEQNEEEFSGLIHQMKGVGGSYGYPLLTELCAKMEFQVASNHADNLNELMEEFNLMSERIFAGNDENHKIAEAGK